LLKKGKNSDSSEAIVHKNDTDSSELIVYPTFGIRY